MALALKRGTHALQRPVTSVSVGIEVEVQRGGIELVHAAAGEWSRLCESDAAATPFMRPEWHSVYLETIEPNAIVVLVSGRRNGRLIAIMPFIEERVRMAGVPLTVLRQMGSNTSPSRVELIVDPAERGAAIFALWAALRESDRWDLIQIADIPQDGAFEQLVDLAETDGYLSAKRVTRRTPFINLPDAEGGLAEVMARVRGDFRRNTQRRLRKLKTLGNVQFSRIDTYDPEWLEAFYALEASGWKGEAGTAIAVCPQERAYHDALARAASAGGFFRMYRLDFDGQPIAMHYGLCMNGTYSIPKTAYDERFHEYAPGHLILQESIRDSIAEGLTELDFLGHEMTWKRSWTNDRRIHHRYYIFKPTLLGHTAHGLRFKVFPMANRTFKTIRASVPLGGNRHAPVEA